MADVALVFPPSTFLSAPLTWPPLGLWYIATQLERRGHKTEFLDLSIDKFPEDGEFDQVWISATTPQLFEVRKLGLKTQSWTETKTVLGGAAPWATYHLCKDLPFDVIVSGEADHPDVVPYILKEAEDGLYNARQKHITIPTSKTLDWVLPPTRRWSRKYKSEMTDLSGNKYDMTTMFTARGCPMECAFCESGRRGVIWDRLVRYEPLWSVEHQLLEITRLGYDGLTYYDDIFILNKNRTLKLLKLHENYNLVWRCFLRSDILHKHGGKEYLQKMKDAGLIELFVGVESADNRIKKNIHKGTTIEQDQAVLEWCKELDIKCKMSFIFGLPGENRESLKTTIDWILKNRPHVVQVDRLIPFTGTPLTSHPEKYDLIYEEMPDEEWFFRGRHDANSRSFVRTSELSAEEIDFVWHEFELELLEEGLSGYTH